MSLPVGRQLRSDIPTDSWQMWFPPPTELSSYRIINRVTLNKSLSPHACYPLCLLPGTPVPDALLNSSYWIVIFDIGKHITIQEIPPRATLKHRVRICIQSIHLFVCGFVSVNPGRPSWRLTDPSLDCCS